MLTAQLCKHTASRAVNLSCSHFSVAWDSYLTFSCDPFTGSQVLLTRVCSPSLHLCSSLVLLHHPAFSPPQLPPKSGGYFWVLVSPSKKG